MNRCLYTCLHNGLKDVNLAALPTGILQTDWSQGALEATPRKHTCCSNYLQIHACVQAAAVILEDNAESVCQVCNPLH